MLDLRAAIFAALAILGLCSVAGAGDVTLISRDGTVRISGDLLGYDGEFFRVDTVYGVLTVDGSGVLCDGPGCPDLARFVAEVRFSGARTMGEVLVPALVEAFAARAGYAVERRFAGDTRFAYVLKDQTTGELAAEFSFHVTSTSEGFADLLANEADVVMATRTVTELEVDLAREAGLGTLSDPRRSRLIARDAMAVVVSPESSVTGLTLDQIGRIFTGEIDNWALLGGPDAPITLHLRTPDSGIYQTFAAHVRLLRDAELAEIATLHGNNPDLSDAVAADPFAVGVAPYSETGNARVLEIFGKCGMVSVLDDVTIKTDDYPLPLPLLLYTPERRLPVIAREFLTFARSPAAQAVVARSGFVDLRLYRVPVAEQGVRLVNAIVEAGIDTPLSDLQRVVMAMEGTERLTISFRFKPGSTALDLKSRSNVEVLAAQIEAGAFDNLPLIFVGFTDSDGPAETNLRLSRRRAATVRDAVLSAAPTADRNLLSISVEGFGEALPMACDETEWGRHINRRVEVWVAQR